MFINNDVKPMVKQLNRRMSRRASLIDVKMTAL